MFELLSIIFCILLVIYYISVVFAFFQDVFETRKEFYTSLLPFGILLDIAIDKFKELK